MTFDFKNKAYMLEVFYAGLGRTSYIDLAQTLIGVIIKSSLTLTDFNLGKYKNRCLITQRCVSYLFLIFDQRDVIDN